MTTTTTQPREWPRAVFRQTYHLERDEIEGWENYLATISDADYERYRETREREVQQAA